MRKTSLVLAILLACSCLCDTERSYGGSDEYLYDWDHAGARDPAFIADTPRFVLKLSDGNLLCFSIEGFELFTYNLITSNYLVVNTFVNITDSPSGDRIRTHTDIGIIIKAVDKRVKFGTRIFKHVIYGQKKKVVMQGFGEMDISRGSVTFTLEEGHSNIASEQSPYEEFVVVLDKPKAEVRAVSFDHKGFSIFVEESEGLEEIETHGLLGQFLSAKVRIDTRLQKLVRPDPEAPPISVTEGEVWAGLMGGASAKCWYPNGSVLEGMSYDYIIENLLATNYKYSLFKDYSKSR